MTDRRSEYAAVQQRNFGALARAGRFRAGFKHKPEARAFVRKSVLESIESIEAGGAARPAGATAGLKVLDCGCGAGAWLDFIRSELTGRVAVPPRCYGFDLTAEMVALARLRLPDLPPGQLRQGDILDPESYSFDPEEPKFDLIFCYDVVQQLPRELQLPACETMAAHLTDGGVALIFDRERNSLFGWVMGGVKFLRRYLKLPLVPAYYTAARYPPLNRFARALEQRGYQTGIKAASNGRRRAMTVRQWCGNRVANDAADGAPTNGQTIKP